MKLAYPLTQEVPWQPDVEPELKNPLPDQHGNSIDSSNAACDAYITEFGALCALTLSILKSRNSAVLKIAS